MTRKMTYEQAAELAGEIARQAVRDELATIQQTLGHRLGGLTGALVATSQPRIDGKITFADEVLAGGIVLLGCFSGVPAGLASEALNGPPFGAVWGCVTLASVAVGGLRILFDAFDLPSTFSWVLEFRRFRNEWYEFCEWREARSHDEPTTVRTVPVYSGGQSAPQTILIHPEKPNRRDYELANGRIIAFRELYQFLETACTTGDWTRSGWCGGDGKDGRGMSQPVWRGLKETLEPLGYWGVDRPTLSRFVSQLTEQ